MCAPPDKEFTDLLTREGVPLVPFDKPWRSWERPPTAEERQQRVADFIVPLTPNFPAEKCGAEFQDVDKAGQPICRYPRFRETLPGGRSYEVLDQGNLPIADDTDLYTVPAGDVFLMGDNRDDSADSRFAPPVGMGYIPMERIEGKAVVGFWSTDGSAEWLKPWTWVTAARWSRIGEGF